MPSVKILNRDVDVDFLVGEEAVTPLDQPVLLDGLGKMAELINKTAWTPEQSNAFQLMKKIVFFEGKVVVNGTKIDRPCCDQDDAVFYWEGNEFTANMDPRVHANTYFHDCWHVVQFNNAGWAREEHEQVYREVDAINHQIEVARAVGCRPEDVDFLIRFRDDQGVIQARLQEGLHNRPAPTAFA